MWVYYENKKEKIQRFVGIGAVSHWSVWHRIRVDWVDGSDMLNVKTMPTGSSVVWWWRWMELDTSEEDLMGWCHARH